MIFYNTIKDSLAYELTYYPEDNNGWTLEEIDLERTARRVWKWAIELDMFAKIRVRQEWEQSESIHHITLDWLSMYEPTTKERSN